MKKTKQQIIVQLEKDRDFYKKESNDYGNFLARIKNILVLRPGDYNRMTIEDAIEEIRNLIYYKKENEGKLHLHLDALGSENSRLWYLVRAMVKDDTLRKDTTNHDDPRLGMNNTSPFNRPNF